VARTTEPAKGAPSVRSWHARLSGDDGPGAITAAKCYRLLRTICGTAVAEEQLARTPCTIKGAGQERSPERPSVSVPQVYALADQVGPRWRALVLLAAFTGLRFGEPAALRRDRVDLLHETLHVRESISDLPAGCGTSDRRTRGRRMKQQPPDQRSPEVVEGKRLRVIMATIPTTWTTVAPSQLHHRCLDLPVAPKLGVSNEDQISQNDLSDHGSVEVLRVLALQLTVRAAVP